MAKDLRGDCANCPYWLPYSNFCTYYNIELVANGFEATCNNPERIVND